jgi:hypothetical protein
MADDVQPEACDCECHRTGRPCDDECCAGERCPNCGLFLKSGLAEHAARCGAFLRRVPAPVTAPLAGGTEGVR